MIVSITNQKGCAALVKTFKVRLKPNNKQETKLFQYAGFARYVYNWALTRQFENSQLGFRTIRNEELRKEFTELKKTPNMQWMYDISNNVAKQAIKDACINYCKYLKGEIECPRFKSKNRTNPSFYQDPFKIKFTETHVKVEKFTDSRKLNRQKINWIRLCEKGRIPLNCKYVNPRFTFDGLYWYVSVSVVVDEPKDKKEKQYNRGIGIDVGIINLVTCSDGYTYKSINKTLKVRKLERKEKRLQKIVSRKYEKNKEGDRYRKTENIKKTEIKILKIKKRLKDIRDNYIKQTINEIVSRKPAFICIEDLDIDKMLKNKRLARAIQNQKLSKFRHHLEYKAELKNIPVVIADRFFPSSKKCVCCGMVKKELTIADRIYVCKRCGNIMDRDYQASLNLMYYGENYLQAVT